MRVRLVLALISSAFIFPATLWAYGEGGDITYNSRAIHLLTNEARLDTREALQSCGKNCSEGLDCYQKTLDPVYWDDDLHRAAQFHANMLSTLGGCIQHDSPCELVASAATDFPKKCDGDPACACKSGKAKCGTVGTGTFARIKMFSDIGSAENIASNWGTPMDTFKLWLLEDGNGDGCTFTMNNGHRFSLLAPKNKSHGVGSNAWVVQDFGRTAKKTHAIAAASHYRDGGNALQFKAVYKAVSAAVDGKINIGGTCHDLKRSRGTDKHGLWSLTPAAAPAKCTAYFFEISNADGKILRYPSTGSLLYGEHKGEVCEQSWQAGGLETCFEGGVTNPTEPVDSEDPEDSKDPILETSDANACSSSVVLGGQSHQMRYGASLILLMFGLVLLRRSRKQVSLGRDS